LGELGIAAAQGTAGLNELLKIIAKDEDERLPVDARASLVVLAAELEALQTLIGSIKKRIMAQNRQPVCAPANHDGVEQFASRASPLQLIQRDWQIAHPLSGGVIDRVGDGRRHPDDADLAKPFHA
jgi:hypothetical protein